MLSQAQLATTASDLAATKTAACLNSGDLDEPQETRRRGRCILQCYFLGLLYKHILQHTHSSRALICLRNCRAPPDETHRGSTRGLA